MSSALLQIETEMAQRLESIPFFEPFASRNAILVDPRKNIVAEVKTKIKKLKTLIAPKVLAADDNHPNIHGVYLDEIRMVVGVFQNPLIKGNDPDTMEIAEEVHKAFKNWTPDSLSNVVNPRRPGIEQIESDELNIHNCNFETKGGFIGALPSVATPTGTASGEVANFALACATAGAAIFYTTNGKNPTPRNGIYYNPASAVEVLTAVTIKARAYLAGYLRSELFSANYTPLSPD